MFGARLSFQETFCGPHNKEIVKGIAEFPFHDLVVEQIQIARKIIPLDVMFDVVTSVTIFRIGCSALNFLFSTLE